MDVLPKIVAGRAYAADRDVLVLDAVIDLDRRRELGEIIHRTEALLLEFDARHGFDRDRHFLKQLFAALRGYDDFLEHQTCPGLLGSRLSCDDQSGK